MNPNRLSLVTASLVCLTVISCSSNPQQGKTDVTSCSSPARPPKVYTVEIRDMKFVPESITVVKGDTVIWVNKDMMAHDVTEETRKKWSSGPIVADSTWKMAVSDEAKYYCSIHSVMKGSIELK